MITGLALIEKIEVVTNQLLRLELEVTQWETGAHDRGDQVCFALRWLLVVAQQLGQRGNDVKTNLAIGQRFR
jgi:hypothetical protein